MDKNTIENVFGVMRGIWNTSLLWGHVEYFEKKIPDEIEPFIGDMRWALNAESQACVECHNFGAWIRLYSELICNKAMTRLSHHELCSRGPTDFSFEELARMIIEKATVEAKVRKTPPEKFEAMSRSLKLIIELRHCFQHGGLPRSLRKKAPQLGIELKDVAPLANPQNFYATKQVFYDANLLLELLPTKTISISRKGDVEFQ
jgi:hypothetical protein